MAKKLENKGVSLNRGMAEQIVVYDGGGILLSYKEWRTDWFLYELERPPRTDTEWKEHNQENIVHSNQKLMGRLNVIDSAIRSNAMIKNYPMELMKKNAIHS